MNNNGEPVYVGRDFGGREIVVDHALVDRYVAALGQRPAMYSKIAPALMLHSECYESLSWYLANIWGNLHARQEWELFGAMQLGSVVRTHGFIRERYRKRGRDYVVKETWVQDAAGRLLSRGLTHQSFLIPDEGSQPVAVDKDREKRTDRTFDIGGKGRPLAALGLAVTDEVCMAFSGPTENYHTNREAARALGFPDIVVQGMLPICLASELLTREYGEGWTCGGKMDVRLVNVLWAGERIEARAEETHEVPEAGRTRVHLDVWVEKAEGTKVILGTASALR